MTTLDATHPIHRAPRNDEELVEKRVIVRKQYTEIFDQGGLDAHERLVWVTCPCSRRLAVSQAYKCLYCGVFFCKACAEIHFGEEKP